MDELVRLNVVFGTVEIVEAIKFDGDVIHFGSYRIHRDKDGVELSRTEPSYNFTAHYKASEKTLWQKLTEWMIPGI